MSIDLETYASGDVDYIAKMNANVATIEAAINALQTTQAGMNGAYTIAEFLDALFGGVTTLIGINSYKPTANGALLTVAAGGAYLASSQLCVTGIQTVLDFTGVAAATYYIVPDATGTPTRSTSSTDGVYSVVWSGANFGAITRIAKALMDSTEEDAARISTVNGTSYTSLDARLEAIETDVDTKAAQADLTDLEGRVDSIEITIAPRTRKVGLSLDGGASAIETGVKGAIQIDFSGTIIGWSAIGNQTGSISVEVDLKRTSPPSAPPTAPPIPNTTTDKISASAPVAISNALSASAGEAEVASWANDVQQWDVIQFNVVSCANFRRVTLYVNILEG